MTRTKEYSAGPRTQSGLRALIRYIDRERAKSGISRHALTDEMFSRWNLAGSKYQGLFGEGSKLAGPR